MPTYRSAAADLPQTGLDERTSSRQYPERGARTRALVVKRSVRFSLLILGLAALVMSARVGWILARAVWFSPFAFVVVPVCLANCALSVWAVGERNPLDRPLPVFWPLALLLVNGYFVAASSTDEELAEVRVAAMLVTLLAVAAIGLRASRRLPTQS